jgi:hypothetical protein
MDNELVTLLLNGNSREIKKWILDNFESTTRPDMSVYIVARDFLEIKHTEELSEKTRSLAIATWVLAIFTVATIFGQELLKVLMWPF